MEELHAKISDAERSKNQLLEFDDALMAKELAFGMEFVEQDRQLESDLKLLRLQRSLCEKVMELLKAKYLQIKAKLILNFLFSILPISNVMRNSKCNEYWPFGPLNLM